jgi:hypothetical protein
MKMPYQIFTRSIDNTISINESIYGMLENIAYAGLGFVTVFLALEEHGILPPAKSMTNQ